MKYFLSYRRRGVRARAVAYVLNDHDEEGELDGKGLLGVDGAGDVVGADIGAHDFEDRRLNIGIGDTLDVTVAYVLVPNLEGLGTASR